MTAIERRLARLSAAFARRPPVPSRLIIETSSNRRHFVICCDQFPRTFAGRPRRRDDDARSRFATRSPVAARDDEVRPVPSAENEPLEAPKAVRAEAAEIMAPEVAAPAMNLPKRVDRSHSLRTRAGGTGPRTSSRTRPSMILAHLSDLHLRHLGLPAYRVAETNKLFARAVDALLALEPRPDAVVVTGDLTDCGLVEEYRVLAEQLARLPMPVHLILGNHDRRDTFRAVFGDTEGAAPGFTGFDVTVAGVRLIGLDTVVPGAAFGILCDVRLDDLEARLAARPDVPTLIAMHHPPVACGIGHMDRIALMEGAERFAEIVARHPNIERVLAGHHHRPIQSRFAGTLLQVAPSVAHQVVFDLTENGPPAFVMEPPAYLVHAMVEGTVVYHQAYVERHDGPWPFVLDPAYPGSAEH
jgi:hypothetical protein